MGVLARIAVCIVGLIVSAAAGFALGYYLRNRFVGQRIAEREEEAERVLEEAKARARELELDAKDEAIRLKQEVEEDNKRRVRELNREESRLQHRRESLDHRMDSLEKRERHLREREEKAKAREIELDEAWDEHVQELERIAGLSREEARQMLLDEVQEETKADAARIVREMESRAHAEAERRAREIITTAIQRVASDQVAETTVSSIDLPNDEMKGRIIGRGGRNIRAFESVTGVDLIVDDTPDTVVLSSFDPVRREIARIALERLVLDGRIHPGRIEEMVEKAKEEVNNVIREAGEEAVMEVGVHGLHPEIVKMLGRLRYRTSYGQNVLQHSIETARLASMMASELGADVDMAKTAGLLHDIGKSVDHEVDGSHAIIGAEIAERYHVPDEIVNAIAAHHDEREQSTLEAVLVQAADAISGARPGARRESLEHYIRRIKALEHVATSFQGVDDAYAINAGREVRIMVIPEKVDDVAAINISRDIAKKVEETIQYPGQIKVTVIRETRAVRYAR
ncbi:MAG: ribonuclease Y [Chloroflexota bacterium]|nr:ribonuclease Y [Chloroflexota bacterium]